MFVLMMRKFGVLRLLVVCSGVVLVNFVLMLSVSFGMFGIV